MTTTQTDPTPAPPDLAKLRGLAGAIESKRRARLTAARAALAEHATPLLDAEEPRVTAAIAACGGDISHLSTLLAGPAFRPAQFDALRAAVHEAVQTIAFASATIAGIRARITTLRGEPVQPAEITEIILAARGIVGLSGTIRRHHQRVLEAAGRLVGDVPRLLESYTPHVGPDPDTMQIDPAPRQQRATTAHDHGR
jgi:hypothetical protein